MEVKQNVGFEILFEFGYREKEGPITCFGLFSFFFSKFSFGSHFVNANGNDAYDANDMIKH